LGFTLIAANLDREPSSINGGRDRMRAKLSGNPGGVRRRMQGLISDQGHRLAMNLIRAEIERMRYQISRQRKEIQSLQRAGISTLPAEALLARMQGTVDNLCAERDKLVGEQRIKYPGTNKAIKGPQMRLR
jgi:hypothetical protein